MSDLMLDGKVALVTGASRGIGKAIALELASEGADIIINHLRHRTAAKETAEAIQQKGRQAHIIRANVGEPDKIESMFSEIADKFGHLDILVNNAASGVARKAMDLDERGWAWTMDINARAFLLCSQHAARLMEGRGGKIIAISSLGSRLVMPVYTAVGVSKAALEALTRYLAIEFAPQGIVVNAIAAAAVQTEALNVYKPDEKLSTAWQTTPAGRMVQPEDVAKLVAFLCRDESFMIRGQTIIIDGGFSVAPLIT
jgi:enoyl-[acyl-carrier protein] reductase III